MIITVAELKNAITTDKSDSMLELMIRASESFILNYTKNDFYNRETHSIVYPPDVKIGVINMINYDLTVREKAGIASESISRHSVSYADQSDNNSDAGYPKSVIGFLKPYMKARF